MKVLFCTGGSEKSEDAIRAAVPLVKMLGAEAVVLSVGPPTDMIHRLFGAEFRRQEVTIETDQAVIKNTAKFAERGAKILNKEGIDAVAKTARGEVADEILREAQGGEYDFIVVSAKGRPGDRHLLGSNTRKVLAKAKIPVYVV